MKLYIKNMVCNRCLEAVLEEFTKAGIEIQNVQLGVVSTAHTLSQEQKEQIAAALDARGFELLEDRNSQYIEQIKTLVIGMIHHEGTAPRVNYSTFLEKEIGKDYHSLSSLFSAVEGLTIERYIILQKIEKVKELLIYNQLSLSQIAQQLHYSSVHHLSNQFKKTTGMSPSVFKKNHTGGRKPLDKLKE